MSKLMGNLRFILNNELIPYEPDSLNFDLGLGETKVSTACLGNGQVEICTAEDVTTKIGKVKLNIKAYDNGVNGKPIKQFLRELKENADSNVIQLLGTTFAGTMTKASLVNEPNIQTGSESVLDLEFQGQPIV